MTMLRDIRKAAKYTQQELGQKLNVTQSLISKWEKGSCNPSMSMLIRLSNVLGCTIDDLLKPPEERKA